MCNNNENDSNDWRKAEKNWFNSMNKIKPSTVESDTKLPTV